MASKQAVQGLQNDIARGIHLPNRCFELSSVYVIVLLILYASRRECTIPLTYNQMFDNWGGVQSIFLNSPVPVSWTSLDALLWCPAGIHSSPQCSCFQDYYNNTYVPDILRLGFAVAPNQPPLPAANASVLAALGQKHSNDIVMNCLRHRPSWRRSSCGDFCRIHLSTPIILASFYMSALFSGVTSYHSSIMRTVAYYTPPLTGLCIIVLQLTLDRTGGIISSLSILSVVLESYYLGPNPPWKSQVFWSYHRFLLAALSAWAAITHQARDIYLVAAYTFLSFFAGFLAYTVYLIRQGHPGAHSGATCMHVYVGIGAILTCFVLLIQQHWYWNSPLWSSAISPVIFAFALAQCLSQAPFGMVPVAVNLLCSLSLLSAAFIATVVDLTGGGV